ncbi:MAG: competence type IV pilus major pilin ComGC [Armatimonadota bacterium]
MASERGFFRRGFTLVEIMIVVLIIGILLAIAVPQFFQARDNARAKTCQHNLKQILGAKERWAMETNQAADATPTWDDLVIPGRFLNRQPECPSDGDYEINPLDEVPTCSIGGVRGERAAHAVP